MATRLTKIKVDEVSLVTRPAIAKEFLLYKSEDGAQEESIMVDEIVKTTEPVVVEEPIIDTQVEKQVKCPECGQVIDEEEARKMKKGDSCKACSDKKVKKDAEDLITKQMEDIQKALEQERVEKAALTVKVEELEKAAFDAKQAEITKAFIEKAAVELKNVPGMTAQSFGPVLKAASDKLAPAEFNVIYDALKAASAFIQANSRLTKELGVGGEDLSADPAQQLDAIAKSYVSKDSKITYAKAYETACMNNPQLYSEHVRQARNR